MGRSSSPILEEFAHLEGDAVELVDAPNEADVTSASRLLPERFLSFVNLFKRPRLTRAQKRLFDRPLDDLERRPV